MIFGKKRTKTPVHQIQKDEYFDFDRIASYHQWKLSEPAFQNINDHTWADLDMDEVFMTIDRTYSKPGQQYLYYLIRSIPSSNRFDQIDECINKIENEEKKTFALIESLNKLDSRGSYFLHNLFTGKALKKPRWFVLAYVLLITTVGSLVGSFFLPPLILITLFCLVFNFITHYWNKSKLLAYSNAISQLYHLDKACDRLSFVYIDSDAKTELTLAQKALKGLTRKSSLLRDNSQSHNELSAIGDVIIELVKASLLIEPIMLYNVMAEVQEKKDQVKLVFEAVGFVDVCLTIQNLRKALNCTIPKFTDKRALRTTDCYHPLIKQPISNSIHIDEDKSILISGSNMSGKTTFIRTLGINALLSQTINLVFAEDWTAPKMRIFSAIRISDNLLNDESFYQKEVKVVHEMIEESKTDEMCLFLIDELYKGTNSIERIGAGVAVLSYLHGEKSIVCTSTHDLELSEYLTKSFDDYHFTEHVDQSSIQFDYQLKTGKLQNTNAIRILEANKYPEEVTNEARKIAGELAKT